ncbi:uncharacterized protein METZ01_LOCUS188806 [marine metagenome]|uniref:Uncharacterized protein n=1 Tax=marine metagenome TaxID=408172 RepID=A0A382DD49_9ZZZZ
MQTEKVPLVQAESYGLFMRAVDRSMTHQ